MRLIAIYLPTLILITLLIFLKARGKFGFHFFILFSSYLLINLIIELLANVFAHYHYHNLYIYNIAILIEGLTFCYMFYYANNNKVIKKALVIATSVFILFWVINFCFIQKSRDTLNTYTYLLSCIILSIFSLITIYRFVFQNSFNNPFY